jgi:predicted SnoaL-like aldol condensation-catalyzing enzyme
MADTAKNKERALELMNALFTEQGPEVAQRLLAPDYIQHNPNLPNGVESLKGMLGMLTSSTPGIAYESKRAVAEGDFVMIHGHLKMSAEDAGMAVVDIVRFDGDTIAEHWDVTQPIPAESANDNTMF